MKTLQQFIAEIPEPIIQEAAKETQTDQHYNFKDWKNAAKKIGCTVKNMGAIAGTLRGDAAEQWVAEHDDSSVGGSFIKGKPSSQWNYGHLSYYPKVEEAYSPLDHTQYGSNEGGVHIDDKGDKYYVKYPKHEEQARVEVATAKLYNKMGIETVNPRIEQIDGRTAVVSDWNHDLKIVGKHQLQTLAKEPHHAMELAKMRHAAVITGNRDIVGLQYDNIGYDVKKDRLVSLDQGGSMHYRAQGEKKPFEREVGEHESFDNPRYTPHHVFGAAVEHHPEILRNALDHVKNLKDDDIRSIMSEHGLDDHKETVVDRKKLLLKKY